MERISGVPVTTGMESVWDYPRPPRLERSVKRVEVFLGGLRIADSKRAMRVLETSHPPVYYIPPTDIIEGALRLSTRHTFCEFKGAASYYDVVAGGEVVPSGAWYYPAPSPGYEAMAGFVAFYPGRMDRCMVGDEQVLAQPGDFYGGWITRDIAGPFKGGEGTAGW